MSDETVFGGDAGFAPGDESEADQFKVGDVVWLKHGGCPMTVVDTEQLVSRGYVALMWFNDSRELQKGVLRANALTKERPENGLVPKFDV